MRVGIDSEQGTTGLMGFAVGSGRDTGSGYAKPWWIKAAESEKWPEKGFGLYLGRRRSGEGTVGGDLTLG